MSPSLLETEQRGDRLTITYDSGTYVPNLFGGGLLAIVAFGIAAAMVVALIPSGQSIECTRSRGTCAFSSAALGVRSVAITDVRSARVEITYRPNTSPPRPARARLYLVTEANDLDAAVAMNPSPSCIRAFHTAAESIDVFLANPAAPSITASLPKRLGGGILRFASVLLFPLIFGVMYWRSRRRTVAVFDKHAGEVRVTTTGRSGPESVSRPISDLRSIAASGWYWKKVAITTRTEPLEVFFAFGTPRVQRGVIPALKSVSEFLAIPITPA